jgi:putative hydrolase of the HAD superfamily
LHVPFAKIALMAPRAILLDALGTLLAIDDPVARLLVQLRERHAIEVAPERAALALRAEMSHYREHCVQASDAERLHALRLDCAAIVGRELGGAAAALEPAALLPTLLASLRFVPYADVLPALERWRAAGARLVVASNWDVSLHQVLRESGLAEHLDAVATSAEVGASKPSGELFAAALALAGVDARQAVHVGDSFGEDVEGARAAGIEAVWLRRDRQDGTAPTAAGVRVITTLEDF